MHTFMYMQPKLNHRFYSVFTDFAVSRVSLPIAVASVLVLLYAVIVLQTSVLWCCSILALCMLWVSS